MIYANNILPPSSSPSLAPVSLKNRWTNWRNRQGNDNAPSCKGNLQLQVNRFTVNITLSFFSLPFLNSISIKMWHIKKFGWFVVSHRRDHTSLSLDRRNISWLQSVRSNTGVLNLQSAVQDEDCKALVFWTWSHYLDWLVIAVHCQFAGRVLGLSAYLYGSTSPLSRSPTELSITPSCTRAESN